VLDERVGLPVDEVQLFEAGDDTDLRKGSENTWEGAVDRGTRRR
jgi:hypothetical protein